MTFRRFLVPLLLLLCVLLLGGCRANPSQPVQQEDPAVLLGFATPATRAPTAETRRTPVPTLTADELRSPEAVVRAFYEWYFRYMREMGDPLVERAYRTVDYLAVELVQKIDSMPLAAEAGEFNPFLCGQAVPESVDTRSGITMGDMAEVVVQTSIPGHWFTLSLARTGRGWEITEITCPGSQADSAAATRSPDQVVQDFFAWYLAYRRVAGDPLADGVHKLSPFLSEAAIAQIEQIRSALGSDSGYDPVLCASRAPEDVVIDPAQVTGDDARVYTRMIAEDGSPISQTITLKRIEGQWKIHGLTCAIENRPPTAVPEGESAKDAALTVDWQVYRDTTFNYEVKYPRSWRFTEPATALVGEETILRHVIGFTPKDAPDEVVPVVVEVYVGPEEEPFLQTFPGTGKFEKVELNGLTVFVDSGDPTQGRSVYVFPAPRQSNVWVVLRVDTQPVATIRDLNKTVAQILSTFRFLSETSP